MHEGYSERIARVFQELFGLMADRSFQVVARCGVAAGIRGLHWPADAMRSDAGVSKLVESDVGDAALRCEAMRLRMSRFTKQSNSELQIQT